MAIDHFNCGNESGQFCEDLLSSLKRLDTSTSRHETSRCGFLTTRTNRFAYLYHNKSTSSIATIFLRGDEPNLIPSLSNGAAVQIRERLSGNWAKEFPMFIHIPVDTSADEVAELLFKYSLPLAAKKRGSRAVRERINDIDYRDGKVKTVLSTRYERSRTLRAICLKHFGYRCAGCDVVLADLYGSIAETLIHVHHLERIADAGESQIDPIKDLIPLCPNCHAVVHLKTPPISIKKLRRMILQ